MPKLHDLAVRLIREAAAIPSFSSYEERAHPWVRALFADQPGVTIEVVHERNLLITVPGQPDRPPVALAAHLDKINHFGTDRTDPLPVTEEVGYLEGQLDDAAGLGLVLAVALNPRKHPYPTLYVLLSEMEESMGLKQHPHLLRNGGEGLYHGMGAERLARHLIATGRVPAACVTVDTTPLFRGQAGTAIYAAHWEFTNLEVTDAERKATEQVRDFFLSTDPDLRSSNNTNDYLVYGRVFSTEAAQPVPSIALEPAIFPYHQIGERVFLHDIRSIADLLDAWLAG